MAWKLVRDKIPDIVASEGGEVKTKVLENGSKEYLLALANKLVEESNELLKAVINGDRRGIIEELCDISEILLTLPEAHGIHYFLEVERARQSKRYHKGGFEKRIFMEFTEPK